MDKIKIGDACEVLNGYAFKSDKYVDSGIRVIRITNVQKGYVEDDNPQFYPVDESENVKDYMLESDDLLISLTGNVGRVALLGNEWLPAALNQRVACLRPKRKDIRRKYIYYALLSKKFEDDCIISSKGIAQKNMSTEWLKQYEINFPTEEKQAEIIAIFDKLVTIISKRIEEIQKLDFLIKARFVEMFGNPIANPMGWKQVPLSSCLESIDNGKSFVCETEARHGDWPAVLKLSAVTYGDYRPEENKAMLDEKQFIEDAAVRNGNLLFTRKNTPELVGMCAYVYNTPNMLMMPDLIFRLNTTNCCNKVFLWKLINHELFRSCIQNIATGSAKSMSNISKERLFRLEIILPPLEMQNQFADFVHQVDKSKFEVQKALEETQILMDALMQKYFG